MLFAGFVLAFAFLHVAAEGGYDYSTNCECTQAAPNGTFCWAWKCYSNAKANTKCFPNGATVEIKTGRQRVAMEYVRVGEEVLVGVDSHGRRLYEPVYAFIHASASGLYDYLQITTDRSDDRPLVISSGHLLFRFNESKALFAGHLNVGDRLQTIDDDGRPQPATIRDVRLIKRQGFYAPLTRSGKLLVDGISVSNYALVANHQFAHLAMQPFRWAHSLLGWSMHSEEIHWYCHFLYDLVEQINKRFVALGLYDGQMTVSHL